MVEVELQPKAAGGVERDEPVNDRAEAARRVERVVPLNAIARKHRKPRPEKRLARGRHVLLAGPCRPERGRIEARPVAGELPVRVAEGEERLVARLADRRAFDPVVGFARSAHGERPLHRIEAVDMLVERRRPHAEVLGKAGERDRFEPVLVRNGLRCVDHALRRESCARHQLLVPSARKLRIAGVVLSGISACG